MSDEMVKAGKRLAIVGGALGPHWWNSYSPRNENDFAEGPWCQWVHLARKILAHETTKRDMPEHYREYDAPHLYDEPHPDCLECQHKKSAS